MKTGKPESILQVENLSVSIQDRGVSAMVVEGIGFRLEPGEIMGLVGESGCGKTMLAKAIMKLLPKKALVTDDSMIVFDGQNLTDLSESHFRRIAGKEMAMVFQNPVLSLNPVMKIGVQITEVLQHHLKYDRKKARNRAIELLQQSGIPMPEKRCDQYPHQLSGGLSQRVAIAIALSCEPRLLIADEPTTALDTSVQADILDLLEDLSLKKKMAMLIITHDLSLVAGRTDTTAVMYAGKIVEYAPTSELFGNIRMPYTKALVDSAPRIFDPLNKRLYAIKGEPPDPFNRQRGCPFVPRCGYVKKRCTREEPCLQTNDDDRHMFACWRPL